MQTKEKPTRARQPQNKRTHSSSLNVFQRAQPPCQLHCPLHHGIPLALQRCQNAMQGRGGRVLQAARQLREDVALRGAKGALPLPCSPPTAAARARAAPRAATGAQG